MKIHQLSPSDALSRLDSDARGLTRAEAARRLEELGDNSIEEVARLGLWQHLIKEFTTFFSVILWVAAGLALLAERIEPGQGMAKIGYAIVAVILVSGIFSFWQEFRVEQTLAELRKLLPGKTSVLRDNKAILVPSEQLVPGDVILLEQGSNVPADCRLIESVGVRVDMSAVTGESLPKARDAAPSDEVDLAYSKNILFAGTAMVSGKAKAIVFATGRNTEFGKIARLAQTAGDEISPLRMEISYLSRLIAILAVLIGLVFFGIGRVIGVSFWQDFMFAIGIIVAMVPEGLLPTLTLSLVLATQRMARCNVLVRYLPSVEALGSTMVLCTDKTGTLTRNQMVVRQIFLGTTVYSLADKMPMNGIAALYRPFFLVSSMCHDLKETEVEGSRKLTGDPMEVALAAMANRCVPDISAYPVIDEMPFDTDRMRLSTVHQTPDGPVLYCKGAPEAMLPLCKHILIDGKMCALDMELIRRVEQAHEGMARKGMRVLAFAFKELVPGYDPASLEKEMVFCGLAGLEDPPRPEVPAAIRKCSEAGIKVIMVTGDHPRTAETIAREIGLVRTGTPIVVTGEQLRSWTPAALKLALDAEEIIFARVAPYQKMLIVEAIKEKKQIVAVTGDGVNDAPALKAAHIGIAMGIRGTDVARQAADVVLLDDNFASIVRAIEEGRAVFDNIRKFLTYVLVHNVAELIPFLAFVLFRIPLALTPLQVLFIDMGTDSLTALGLGVERPDPAVMQRPPRPRSERLMNVGLALRAYLFLGLIEGSIAMAGFYFVLHSAGWRYGQSLPIHGALYRQATTACLSAIIAMQMVNVFMCKSSTRSVFAMRIADNPLIIYGVILEIALLLLANYSPWWNALLGTEGIGTNAWIFIMPFAAVMLCLEEVRKWIARNGKRA